MLHSGDDCDDDEFDALSIDDYLDIAEDAPDAAEYLQEWMEEGGSGDDEDFLEWRKANHGF